ncbi:SusC/RagA family TonB-linked outer membrane protein [Sinomicrobium soli]|uniref:SusC/RagA family TonB-linked outer membrane protein n=1 Tax=Sinomicrobium sp. N-1-3-6 TaxID=2219864 RepID=UPI000DCE81E2|nr:TonB-dependent receptor [Sinomicrobium sp. N-1-3-6]RAV28100.1 TonB-dependent receptor [Sinomicrobium sp. N-1-3-6]
MKEKLLSLVMAGALKMVCICCFTGIQQVYAFERYQSLVKISGTIVDENNVPMIGVTIRQENTSRGTTTDFDGNFELEVEEGSTILISYVGYLQKRYENITPETGSLDIQLEPDATNLDEVVVIGYGEQTKQTVVGSVSTVEGKKLLETGSVSTISEALQGQSPGLMVINSNGKPGSDAGDIFIRGKSTWGNTSPLVLVDGIERDLNNIDPNEIETISVLKDAASTAVYGVRGANGVILITTKRGTFSEPIFNFSANLGIKSPTTSPEKADYITAMRAFNEAVLNDRNYDQLIPQSTIDAWTEHYAERGPYNPYFPEVDWYDRLIDKGYEQTYNLNVRGGGSKIKYFASLGYRNDGDIFQTEEQPEYDPAFGLKKYNWRTNLDFNLTSSTKFSVGFSGNYRVRNQPGYRISNGVEDGYGQAQFYGNIYKAPPNLFPLYYPDGVPGESSDGEGNLSVYFNEGGQRTYQYYQGFYDAQLEQKLDFITKGLSFNGSINYSSFSNYSKQILRGGVQQGNRINIVRYYRAYDYSQPSIGPDGEVEYPLVNEIRWPTDDTQEGPVNATTPDIYGYNRQLNYRFQLKYKKAFDDHNIDATALMLRQNMVSRNGFAARREEWIGRLSYNYKKRYLIEASGNYSGSEKFAPGLRFGFFPSIGAAWVISEEPFVKKMGGDWLDFLKVNYSYGIVGSDNVARFQYMQTYDGAGNINFGYENLTGYGPLFTEGTIANAAATWETSTQQNLKFTVNLFKKIDFELDMYQSDREGILMARKTVPSFVGFPDLPDANIGRSKSHGYELTLGWRDQIGSDFNYNISLGTSFTENRIVFRDDPAGMDVYLKEAGKPIHWKSRLIAGGFYQSVDDIFNGPNQSNGSSLENLVPGDVLFVDYNGDGISDTNDKVPMEEVGYPLRTYNLQLGFNWKNLGFNALFYGVTDVGYVYPNVLYFDFAGGFIQAQPDVLTRWTPETKAIAEKPALHLSNNHNSTASTLLYKDGSYLRLKNIEINYNFQNKFLKDMGIKRLQLYANGNNVYTWSKLGEGIDPETDGAGNYPIVKRYNLGIRVTF